MDPPVALERATGHVLKPTAGFDSLNNLQERNFPLVSDDYVDEAFLQGLLGEKTWMPASNTIGSSWPEVFSPGATLPLRLRSSVP